MDQKNRSLLFISFALIILFLASTLVYVNSITGEFISDDNYQILRNEWITSFTYLPSILFSSVWDFMPGEGDINYYRPVKYILYTFCYKLSELSPWGYHLMKMVLHGINAMLLFLIARSLLTEHTRGIEEKNKERVANTGAFLAALFFGLHPINTEAVSWIAAVPEVSFTLFALLSLLFLIKRRYLLMAVAFFLSALSKESGMIVPFILVAYDLLLRREPVLPLSNWIKRYAGVAVAGCLFIAIRVYSLSGEFISLSITGETLKGPLTGFLYYLNFGPLFFKYLGKFVWPTNITFFYYDLFPPVRSITEGRAIFYIVLFICFLALIVVLYKRSRLLLFALTWLLIMIAPPFILGWTTGSAVYESRYLYGAVPGFTIFFAFLVVFISAKLKDNKLASGIIIALVLAVIFAYGAGTVKRNNAWQNEYVLWKDAAAKNPQSRNARNSHGIELIKLERLNEALGEFEAAKLIDPDSSAAYNNAGIIHARQGNMGKAAENFDLAVRLDPENVESRVNLERALRALGRD